MSGRYSRSPVEAVAGEAAEPTYGQKARAWLPVAAWMGVVLLFSTGGFSADTSSRFIGPLLRALGFPPDLIPVLHFWIRKSAHFVEYAGLGFLAFRAARLSWAARGAAAVALGLALGLAAVDEGHQATLASRTGSARDVAIDLAGAAFGVALRRVLFLRLR
jgi:VanZ family protein